MRPLQPISIAGFATVFVACGPRFPPGNLCGTLLGDISDVKVEPFQGTVPVRLTFGIPEDRPDDDLTLAFHSDGEGVAYNRPSTPVNGEACLLGDLVTEGGTVTFEDLFEKGFDWTPDEVELDRPPQGDGTTFGVSAIQYWPWEERPDAFQDLSPFERPGWRLTEASISLHLAVVDGDLVDGTVGLQVLMTDDVYKSGRELISARLAPQD